MQHVWMLNVDYANEYGENCTVNLNTISQKDSRKQIGLNSEDLLAETDT